MSAKAGSSTGFSVAAHAVCATRSMIEGIVSGRVPPLFVAIFGAIPAGLTTYPLALTLRFFFAACVAYVLFFAIASATQRTAGIILGTVAAMLLVQYVLTLAAPNIDLMRHIVDALFTQPGVFSIFSGRWSLVDA